MDDRVQSGSGEFLLIGSLREAAQLNLAPHALISQLNENTDKTNMTLALRQVTVKPLPEQLNAESWRLFVCELEEAINVARPRIVLDCSNLRQMDRAAIQLLLCCLEEAMKRNGDVRLAGMSQEARATLESIGVDRLFRIFDLCSEAESSFHRHADGSISTNHTWVGPAGADQGFNGTTSES